DLQHGAPRARHEEPADLSKRLWIAEGLDDRGVDPLAIEPHRLLCAPEVRLSTDRVRLAGGGDLEGLDELVGWEDGVGLAGTPLARKVLAMVMGRLRGFRRRVARSTRSTGFRLTLEVGPGSILGMGRMKDGLKIGELARRCGVSPDAVRFYERERLMPRARR